MRFALGLEGSSAVQRTHRRIIASRAGLGPRCIVRRAVIGGLEVAGVIIHRVGPVEVSIGRITIVGVPHSLGEVVSLEAMGKGSA